MTTVVNSVVNDESKTSAKTSAPYEHQLKPLTEPSTAPGKHPQWIGQKFEPDGRVLPFPGNTIICHLPPSNDLHSSLLDFSDRLQKQSFISSFVLLPPSSWHMTIFEGVSDHVRRPGSWPGDIALDSTLEECNTHVQTKLDTFDLACEVPIYMKFVGWWPLDNGIALKIGPASTEGEKRLRDLRDRLAKHLNMRHPGHEEYSFHVSIGYSLKYFTQQEKDTILAFLEAQRANMPTSFELGAPEYCVFEDMFAFNRVFHLRNLT